jgi:phosphoribosylanthranilate isomerase
LNALRPGVKICGVTRVADALVALDAGACALGFILASGSPRRLEPAEAQALVGAIRAVWPKPFEAVAVLGGYDAPAARHALIELGFDRVQLVGEEPRPALFDALNELGPLAARAYGAVRVRDAASLGGLEDAPCDAVLLDTYRKGALGGTGHVFDWDLAAPLAARRRIVLAGGLTPVNVAEAVARVKPWRVDVASGVEDAPGIKNAEKVRAFVEAAWG